MRIRRIALLIDGGFFLKRLRRWPGVDHQNPADVKKSIVRLCKSHVEQLCGQRLGASDEQWLDQVYRMFFYDAQPFQGAPYNPLKKAQEDFSRSDVAKFRLKLFDLLRKERKFALRLGSLKQDGEWVPHDKHLKSLLRIWHHVDDLQRLADGSLDAPTDLAGLQESLKKWRDLTPEDVHLPLRQKGVDMKIGLDIASMTLKRQVDTIILVTGDSDFVPAAKVARREGVEFILDPMWQSVDSELMEHIDGIASGFGKPA